jgi:hypothetical protein
MPVPGTIQSLQLTPADMQFLELDKLTTRDVAKVYHIPPPLLGDMDNATLRNFEQSFRAMWDLAIVPVVKDAVDIFNVVLARQYGQGVEVFADLSEVEALRENALEKSKTVLALTQAGTRTIWALRQVYGDDVDEAEAVEPAPEPVEPPVDEAADTSTPVEEQGSPDATGERMAPSAKATADDRRRETLARLSAARAAVEAIVTSQVHDGLEAQAERAKDAAALLWGERDAGSDIAAVIFPEWSDDPIARVLQSAIGNGISAGAAGTIELFELDVELNQVSQASLDFIREHGARQVAHINNATRERLSQSIAAALEQGEGLPGVITAIEDAFALGGEAEELGRYANRARTIAETEMGTAFNHGADAAIAAAGMAREWLYSRLPNSRHGDVDGQVREVGEAFDVHGFRAMYPGDPMLPAEEGINCKCVVAAVLPGADDED